MSFVNEFPVQAWQLLRQRIDAATEVDVQQSLNKKHRTVDDFCALVSSAAVPFLEDMAQESRARTIQRFGKTMQMYVPLYLSNECTNVCTYCGFSVGNKIARKTLTDEEILTEALTIKEMGFDHILLVTGESPRSVGLAYLLHAISILRPFFSNISIEVQPLSIDEYCTLQAAGVYSVLVYQETYDAEVYARHHLKGKKANFAFRLDTPDRLGRAGIHKIGLGALLGLSDWRSDAAAVFQHLTYLERQYWQSRFSVSFPRLRPAEGVSGVSMFTSERDLVQLICAFRLCNENVELSLSTRESPAFRDNAIALGITSMSAGSRTEPGGYAVKSQALKQFETDDTRSPAEVADVIRIAGYEPVWKDWEQTYAGVVNG